METPIELSHQLMFCFVVYNYIYIIGIIISAFFSLACNPITTRNTPESYESI